MSEDRFNAGFHSITSGQNDLRLPSNYTNFPSYSPRHLVHRTPSHCLSRLSGLFFPSVHAQSVENAAPAAVVASDAMTTIERMSIAPQPKVVISDVNVMAYIDLETPRDRIRQMYTKK